MSRELEVGADLALQGRHVSQVLFLELDFASGVSRVCTREHSVDWNSQTWLGAGRVGSIEPIAEGGELEARGIAMNISALPAGLLSIALTPSEYKGREVRLWFGQMAPASDWEPVGVADLDGDGKSDIVWKNASSGSVMAMLMDGAAVTALAQLGNAAGKFLAAVGDFDGNGRDELLWRDADTSVTAAPTMWFPDATGLALAATTAVSVSLTSTQTVSGAGDTDGDGKADLVIRDPSPAFDRIWMMDGATVSANATMRQVPSEWLQVAINDFDDDGNADIFWRNTSTGENYLYPMDGSTILGTEGAVRQVADQNWQIIGSGSFDAADGKDVLWRNLANSAIERGYVYSLDGVSITANEGYVGGMSAFDEYELIGIGDFSGSGSKNECLWWDEATRTAKIAAITFNAGGDATAGNPHYSIAGGTTVNISGLGMDIVADPVGPFIFKMDQLTWQLGGESASLRLTAESRLADWHRPRVRRYNNPDHQALHPGDKFFEHVERQVEAVHRW